MKKSLWRITTFALLAISLLILVSGDASRAGGLSVNERCQAALGKLSEIYSSDVEPDSEATRKGLEVLLLETRLFESRLFAETVKSAVSSAGQQSFTEKIYQALKVNFPYGPKEAETLSAQKVNATSDALEGWGLTWEEGLVHHEIFAKADQNPELKKALFLIIQSSLKYEGKVAAAGKRKKLVEEAIALKVDGEKVRVSSAVLTRVEILEGGKISVIRSLDGKEIQPEEVALADFVTFENPILFSHNYLDVIGGAILKEDGDKFLKHFKNYSETTKSQLSQEIWKNLKYSILNLPLLPNRSAEQRREKPDPTEGEQKILHAKSLGVDYAGYIEMQTFIKMTESNPALESQITNLIKSQLLGSLELARDYAADKARYSKDPRGLIAGFGGGAVAGLVTGAGLPLYLLSAAHPDGAVAAAVGGGILGVVVTPVAALASSFSIHGLKHQWRLRKINKKLDAVRRQVKAQKPQGSDEEE